MTSRKWKSVRNISALFAVLLAGLYFFGYIEITNNGIFFHSKYTVPKFSDSLNYFYSNAPLIFGFVIVLLLIGMFYLALRD